MVVVRPTSGCFNCGSMNHWVRDCPTRFGGQRHSATGANAVPTGPPLLALSAPNASSSFEPVPPRSHISQSNVFSGQGYQANGRVGWWKVNQERLDACYNHYLEDRRKEAKRKEEEAAAQRLKEEEDRKSEWKRELELLELEMGARLDKKLEALGLQNKVSKSGDGELNSRDDQLSRLIKENEELKSKLRSEADRGDDNMVVRLQRELVELRQQFSGNQCESDEIFALKKEIEELRGTALIKTNFENEIAGLRKEVGLLRDSSQRAEEEVKVWKNEALRPGNKRGSVVVDTLECSNRGTSKPRWTDNVRQADKWRTEYRNLQDLQRSSDTEVAMLKERRAEAEKRRMEAELQVKQLQEQLSKLTAEGGAPRVDTEPAAGGTNLKERLEAVALRSAKKGMKATPGRVTLRSESDETRVINECFSFVEGEKKKLRTLKKAGLEPLCKEAGIKLGKVSDMVNKLAEYRAINCLGSLGKKRVGGHVCFRLNDVKDAPVCIRNNRNVVRPSRRDVVGRLRAQISSSFPDLGFKVPEVRRGDLAVCMNEVWRGDLGVCNEDEVITWTKKVEGLVRTPIDHNPGDTLVCCPVKYSEGMRQLFLDNDGFVECDESEESLLAATRAAYLERNFDRLARWDIR
ncbi:hypothetical protein CBR_g77518, partial [Chara braunii]